MKLSQQVDQPLNQLFIHKTGFSYSSCLDMKSYQKVKDPYGKLLPTSENINEVIVLDTFKVRNIPLKMLSGQKPRYSILHAFFFLESYTPQMPSKWLILFFDPIFFMIKIAHEGGSKMIRDFKLNESHFLQISV